MTVLNLLKILREYKVLWAIGTMFGVTQEVDMVMTCANKFGRFAVAVLEPELIPKKMDVIIGNRFFELVFEVEAFDPNVGVRNMRDITNVRSDAGGDEDMGVKEADVRTAHSSDKMVSYGT